MANKWNKIGAIKKSQKGNLYIDVSATTSLVAGQRLQLQNPRDSIKKLADSGKITEEVMAERLAKLPEFIKYDIFLVTEE